MKGKLYLIVIIILTGGHIVAAQQLPKWSSFYENGFIWNPALTAQWYSTEVSATHRQEWTGFQFAPQYSTIGVQVPISDDFFQSRASFGGFVERDQVGPYTKVGISGTYSYKISPQLFGHKKDMLAIGALVQAQRFVFDQDRVVLFDKTRVDPITSAFQPNLSLGFFYRSNAYLYKNENHYFFGASVNRLLPFTFGNAGVDNFDNDVYSTVHAGFRSFTSSQFYVEPSIMMVYGYQKASDVMVSVRGEVFEKYWFGTGVSTNGELFGQMGVVFDGRSLLGPLVGDGILRVGIKSDYRLGSIRQFSGSGYEIYFAYQYEIE